MYVYIYIYIYIVNLSVCLSVYVVDLRSSVQAGQEPLHRARGRPGATCIRVGLDVWAMSFFGFTQNPNPLSLEIGLGLGLGSTLVNPRLLARVRVRVRVRFNPKHLTPLNPIHNTRTPTIQLT